jgi:hypothetical protein
MQAIRLLRRQRKPERFSIERKKGKGGKIGRNSLEVVVWDGKFNSRSKTIDWTLLGVTVEGFGRSIWPEVRKGDCVLHPQSLLESPQRRPASHRPGGKPC